MLLVAGRLLLADTAKPLLSWHESQRKRRAGRSCILHIGISCVPAASTRRFAGGVAGSCFADSISIYCMFFNCRFKRASASGRTLGPHATPDPRLG